MQKLQQNSIYMPLKTLSDTINSLNFWLKPTHFAESWDKVGLILPGSEDKVVDKIMVCIDLSPTVVKEAISKNVSLIVAYHSPTLGIRPSSSNSSKNGNGNVSWKTEIMEECEVNDVAIYSPHTSLDAVAGGMNDCIIEKVLKPIFSPNFSSLEVKAGKPSRLVKGMRKSGLYFASNFRHVSILFDAIKESGELAANAVVELQAEEKGSACLKIFTKEDKEEEMILNISERLGIRDLMMGRAEIGVYGGLRVVDLPAGVTLSEIVGWVKTGLNLDYVQVRRGDCTEFIKKIAICSGSGTSLIGVTADLYITGEMSHHSLLEAAIKGTSVILCSHVGSERHFLPNLVEILKVVTGTEEVFLSEVEESLGKVELG